MIQAEALSILKTGANVFLTGEPGSGKTHMVNAYVRWLREHSIEPAITASTGIAATHIGGMTIHSWSGIGVRSYLSDYDLDHIAQNKRIALRVERTRVLIIDEVSMLSGKILTMVDAVCREIKQSQAPFGGMQVVLVGDFFQLPPVEKRDGEERGAERELFAAGDADGVFAFASPVWDKAKFLVSYLSEQHRQEDKRFLGILSAIRRGSVGIAHKEALQERYERHAPKAAAGITELYSHNANVDVINNREVEKLVGNFKEFKMTSRGAERLVETLKRGCLSPEKLKLKVGARVMFTKNDVAKHTYVNGTLGSVIGFSKEGYPIVKTKSGRSITAEPAEWRIEEANRTLAAIIQVPLRLAWAITVHKSQGMSLDAAHMDLSQTFEYGQGYVALSRVRTLAGLTLAGINDRALEVHPRVLKKDEEFREHSHLARESFHKISDDEIRLMHGNFIKACGGTISKIEPKKHEPKARVSSSGITRELLLRNLSLEDISKERGITLGTIVGHLEELAKAGKIVPAKYLTHVLNGKEMEKIHGVFAKIGTSPLKPVYQELEGKVSYESIRIARLLYKK